MTNESTGTEMTSLRWTSRDLEAFPDDGKRYEIVDGELYVAKQPDWQHQHLCTRLAGLPAANPLHQLAFSSSYGTSSTGVAVTINASLSDSGSWTSCP